MKLYVGNLSFQTTEGALEELFAQFGTVTEAMLVMDKMTQRPRGFGFVTMGTAEEAQKAIEALNGKNVDGRNLIVNEARPREERPPRRDFRRRRRRTTAAPPARRQKRRLPRTPVIATPIRRDGG